MNAHQELTLDFELNLAFLVWFLKLQSFFIFKWPADFGILIFVFQLLHLLLTINFYIIFFIAINYYKKSDRKKINCILILFVGFDKIIFFSQIFPDYWKTSTNFDSQHCLLFLEYSFLWLQELTLTKTVQCWFSW